MKLSSVLVNHYPRSDLNQDPKKVTFMCRVETWRGGENRSVSTSRSSNRTGGFPASGSRRRMSCRRPRKAPFTSTQLNQAKLPGFGGAHVPPAPGAPDPVLGVEPHPQPAANVGIHNLV